MLRAVMLGILLVVVMAVQTVVLPLAPTGWFRPDLLLLVAVAVALFDGPLSGIKVGFAAGLLTDLMLALTPVGIAALVYSGVAFGVGTVRPYLAQSSVSAPLIVAFTSGMIGAAAYGTVAMLLGDERLTATMLAQSTSAVALYNVVLAVPVFALVGRLCRRFPRAASAADDPAF